MVLDTFREGIDAILHPDKVKITKTSVGGALEMYYRFSVIPLVLLAIIALGAGYLLQGVLAATGLLNGLLGGSVALLAVVGAVVYVWGLIPIGLLVFSVIVHWIGKGLDTFKNDYEHTLRAAIYGMFAPLAVLWLAVIPFVGGVIQLIAFVWSIYMLVVILTKEQMTSRVNTLVVLVATAFVIWLITQLITGWITVGLLWTLVGPLLGALASTSHTMIPHIAGAV